MTLHRFHTRLLERLQRRAALADSIRNTEIFVPIIDQSCVPDCDLRVLRMVQSELCVCSVDGSVRVVKTLPFRAEAPNWCADGSFLINFDGQLWRVPPDGTELVPVNTGFAKRLNNDHAPSPDGRHIAISDKTENNASCIYLIPAVGGTPRRVTAAVPSWMHGWSPDGRHIVHAGARGDGPVGIFITDVESSVEQCVTADFDHADGPDYSADGEWIWFNGEKEGAVNLWRVRPDGSERQRMTQCCGLGCEHCGVDWFPHPSPDGKCVVFLRYPFGTVGHPPDVNVALCVMPQGGGPVKELVRFVGGQGSLNVPSWASDSSAFAFFRYSVV